MRIVERGEVYRKKSCVMPFLVGIVLSMVGCSQPMIGGSIREADASSVPNDPTLGPPTPLGQAFLRTPTEGQLLPFSVRLGRLAKVAGVSTSDPLLSEIVSHRLQLGDHDFAHGVRPDRSWSAAKVGLWAKSLLPLCSSDSLRTRYGFLPDHLDEFLRQAYGRTATAMDVQNVTDVLSALPSLDANARHQMTCIAVLSSAEFVIQ